MSFGVMLRANWKYWVKIYKSSIRMHRPESVMRHRKSMAEIRASMIFLATMNKKKNYEIFDSNFSTEDLYHLYVRIKLQELCFICLTYTKTEQNRCTITATYSFFMETFVERKKKKIVQWMSIFRDFFFLQCFVYRFRSFTLSVRLICDITHFSIIERSVYDSEL